jgi:hypothetical protein
MADSTLVVETEQSLVKRRCETVEALGSLMKAFETHSAAQTDWRNAVAADRPLSECNKARKAAADARDAVGAALESLQISWEGEVKVAAWFSEAAHG